MNTSLRKHLTHAALVLTPVAAAFVALPASAAPQHRFVERADHRPPQVSRVTPSRNARIGEHGRTTLSARLSDDRSGVDPRSVRLIVDGLDVSRDARISRDDVVYRERLGRGRHFAELQVRDRAGNLTRSAWSFVVA